MDRVLSNISGWNISGWSSISVGHGGPLSQAIESLSTSGSIASDAPHWSTEPFIPLDVPPLIAYLLQRGELTAETEPHFRRFCQQVDSLQQVQANSHLRRFAAAYADIDPDCDSRVPGDHAVAAPQSAMGAESKPTSGLGEPSPAKSNRAATDEVLGICGEILDQAGYQKLSRQQIEQCAGMASQFGVPLHVNLELFGVLEVYSRGDIIGSRLRRGLRSLYRREMVSIPIYQRMVVLFQLATDHAEEELSCEALHLRMFKNIPKQDIDMLLPGSRIRIRGVDRMKFILPSLGGFLISLRKVAQYVLLFTFFALSKSIIIAALVVAYGIKSVLGYFQTRKHYQLNLTRNLYFQKLDSNAGVVYRIVQQAQRQASVEMVLAYYGILISADPISTRRLRRRCERLVREAIDVEVEFQVARATERLAAAGWIELAEERWQRAADDPR